MTTMPTGRYRGLPIVDVPRTYRQWVLKQSNVRPDLRVSIKRSLGMVVAPLPPAVPDFKMAAAGERGEDA
jgi:uncharacterized protein (DUF3820 family)